MPTREDILRSKAYLVVQRNQIGDYVDVVALTGAIGADEAVAVLLRVDDYYTDRSEGRDSVLTAVTERLFLPDPRDHHITAQLTAYKGLEARWQDWSAVVTACQDLADRLLRAREGLS